MAPKGKKPSDKESGSAAGGGKQKGAQSINVRHILCEKHSKKEEAIKKLNDGVKFDEVAREFSEDKARAGMFVLFVASKCCFVVMAMLCYVLLLLSIYLSLVDGVTQFCELGVGGLRSGWSWESGFCLT